MSDDYSDLNSIIDSVEGLIRDTVKDEHNFVSDIYSYIYAAWAEIEESKLFQKTKENVGKTDIDTLKKAGLTDAQLQLKKAVFDSLKDKSERPGLPFADKIKIIKKAVDLGKILFGTLASIYEIDELIKEFIEVLGESLVEEA